MCTIRTWKRFIAANFAAEKYDPAQVKEFVRAIACGSLEISLTFSLPVPRICTRQYKFNSLGKINHEIDGSYYLNGILFLGSAD